MFALLHRIDPPRNEARFYLVFTGRSLLEPHAVIRFWGRIGGYQRHMVTRCESPAEAETIARRLVRRRLKHGYKIIHSKGEQP